MAELESLKTDNPAVYPSRCFVKLGLVVIYLLIAVARILMLVLNEDFCLLYHPNSLHCKETQTSSWKNWIYILLADILLNLWPLSWLFSMSIGLRNKEKTIKFSWLTLLKSLAFYFFLLDIGIMLTVPILQKESGNHIRIMMIIVIFILIPCGAAYFYLINNFHILSYDPNLNCSTLEFDKEYVEFESSPKTWTVKESGAFRIVLQNFGDEVVKAGTEFLVERVVKWRGIHGNGGNVTLDTTVKFPLKTEGDLEHGETVVLIPETHTEPGTVQIEGYRSFGNVKGNKIWTSIYSKDKALLAKLVQEYVATEEMIDPVRVGIISGV